MIYAAVAFAVVIAACWVLPVALLLVLRIVASEVSR